MPHQEQNPIRVLAQKPRSSTLQDTNLADLSLTSPLLATVNPGLQQPETQVDQKSISAFSVRRILNAPNIISAATIATGASLNLLADSVFQKLLGLGLVLTPTTLPYLRRSSLTRLDQAVSREILRITMDARLQHEIPNDNISSGPLSRFEKLLAILQTKRGIAPQPELLGHGLMTAFSAQLEKGVDLKKLEIPIGPTQKFPASEEIFRISSFGNLESIERLQTSLQKCQADKLDAGTTASIEDALARVMCRSMRFCANLQGLAALDNNPSPYQVRFDLSTLLKVQHPLLVPLRRLGLSSVSFDFQEEDSLEDYARREVSIGVKRLLSYKQDWNSFEDFLDAMQTLGLQQFIVHEAVHDLIGDREKAGDPHWGSVIAIFSEKYTHIPSEYSKFRLDEALAYQAHGRSRITNLQFIGIELTAALSGKLPSTHVLGLLDEAFNDLLALQWHLSKDAEDSPRISRWEAQPAWKFLEAAHTVLEASQTYLKEVEELPPSVRIESDGGISFYFMSNRKERVILVHEPELKQLRIGLVDGCFPVDLVAMPIPFEVPQEISESFKALATHAAAEKLINENASPNAAVTEVEPAEIRNQNLLLQENLEIHTQILSDWIMATWKAEGGIGDRCQSFVSSGLSAIELSQNQMDQAYSLSSGISLDLALCLEASEKKVIDDETLQIATEYLRVRLQKLSQELDTLIPDPLKTLSAKMH